MKASNPKVMIQAYRLLVARMDEIGMTFPLHLGVTEAGNDEDGRIKSAVGIGSLLDDGLGDTIRVSLTEDPVKEIPVARAIAQMAEGRAQRAERERSPSSRIPFVDPGAPFLDDPFFFRGMAPQALARLKSEEFQRAAAADPHFSAYPGVLQTAMENFAKEAKAGVRYGMGTDSGLGKRFPGYFAHWELELMVQAGLTPLQALTAATGSNAEFLGADGIGVIATGKKADLLVLARSPLENIRNTRMISEVFVNGQRVPTIWQTCTGQPLEACENASPK